MAVLVLQGPVWKSCRGGDKFCHLDVGSYYKGFQYYRVLYGKAVEVVTNSVTSMQDPTTNTKMAITQSISKLELRFFLWQQIVANRYYYYCYYYYYYYYYYSSSSSSRVYGKICCPNFCCLVQTCKFFLKSRILCKSREKYIFVIIGSR